MGSFCCCLLFKLLFNLGVRTSCVISKFLLRKDFIFLFACVWTFLRWELRWIFPVFAFAMHLRALQVQNHFKYISFENFFVWNWAINRCEKWIVGINYRFPPSFSGPSPIGWEFSISLSIFGGSWPSSHWKNEMQIHEV